MALLARLYNFMPGDPIISAQMNQELNQIVGTLSGTLTNKNVLIRFTDASTAPLQVDQLGAGAIQSFKNAGVVVASVINDGSFLTTQQLVSTLADGGLSPISVTSGVVCVNLNADKVDGLHGTDFIRKSDTSDQTITSDLIVSKAAPKLTLSNTSNSKSVALVAQDDGNFVLYRQATAVLSFDMAVGALAFAEIPSGPASNPSSSNQLARKAYVDTFLPLSGGTLTGGLTISSGGATITGAVSATGGVTGDKTVGVIGQVVNDVANSGSGETDLNSITIPANTFANVGDMVVISAAGGWATSNSKTLRFYIGGTTMHAIAQSTLGNPEWGARIVIIRTGADTVFHHVSTSGLLFSFVGVGNIDRLTDDDRGSTSSLNFANALTFKITGQGTGSSQVSCQYIICLRGDGA